MSGHLNVKFAQKNILIFVQTGQFNGASSDAQQTDYSTGSYMDPQLHVTSVLHSNNTNLTVNVIGSSRHFNPFHMNTI